MNFKNISDKDNVSEYEELIEFAFKKLANESARESDELLKIACDLYRKTLPSTLLDTEIAQVVTNEHLVKVISSIAGTKQAFLNYINELRKEIKKAISDYGYISIDKFVSDDAAKKDFMSGVLNRRYGTFLLNKIIEDYYNPQIIDKNLFSIAQIDIDNFKLKINEQYGHPYGDYVLRYFGECLRRNFYSSDILIRWGNGDEFLIILQDTPFSQAQNVLLRLLLVIGLYGKDQMFKENVFAQYEIPPQEIHEINGILSHLEKYSLELITTTGNKETPFEEKTKITQHKGIPVLSQEICFNILNHLTISVGMLDANEYLSKKIPNEYINEITENMVSSTNIAMHKSKETTKNTITIFSNEGSLTTVKKWFVP